MKYFTLEWWSAAGADAGNAFREYEAYMKSMLTQLPDQLQRLYKDFSLHDCNLRVFHFDTSTKIFQLELSRFDGDFCLKYEDVRSMKSTSDPDAGLAGPRGYGDLGYDELEILEPGLYEHRMLFSTGIELHVQFTGFSLWYGNKSDAYSEKAEM
jgi:hypothetical protein